MVKSIMLTLLVLQSGWYVCSALGKESMPQKNQITFGQSDYRLVYENRKDTQTAGMAGIYFGVEALDHESHQRRWLQYMSSIWGAYALADCTRLGMKVEQFHGLELSQDKTPLVFLRTNNHAIYILETTTGQSWLQQQRQHFETLPLSEKTRLECKGLSFADSQAMPGYGIQLQLQHSGPVPMLAECSYIPFWIEGRDVTRRHWEVITRQNTSAYFLEIISTGSKIQLFIPAENFEALLDSDREMFRPFQERIRVFKEKTVGMRAFLSRPENPKSVKRFSGFRIGVVFYEMDPAAVLPVGIYKSYIPLTAKAMMQWLK